MAREKSIYQRWYREYGDDRIRIEIVDVEWGYENMWGNRDEREINIISVMME